MLDNSFYSTTIIYINRVLLNKENNKATSIPAKKND